MDSAMEKYSVIDFFNLLICGITFIVFGYMLFPNWLSKLRKLFSIEMNLLSCIILICGILVFSYVIGSIIHEVGYVVLRKIFKIQDRMVCNCLIDQKVIGNKYKFDIYKQKASNFFEKNNIFIEELFSEELCSCFFAHCIYYIQIREQNRKTERLREVQNLSGLYFACFVILFIIGGVVTIIISALGMFYLKILILTMIYGLIAVVFFLKYYRDTKNRIRMVIAVYDACVDMDQCNECS